ncbi:hypothetical protein Hypma_014812 [Hypsizygus marmoreus]|uniref:Uncharacterized protein n=1 Tax=Hypsizygus marmoreus TaxID=39966 RepID=A0A369KCR9_HYPMA|nr:hypothetical protein Hypma_014812 [Hypsizygus marmoreus]
MLVLPRVKQRCLALADVSKSLGIDMSPPSWNELAPANRDFLVKMIPPLPQISCPALEEVEVRIPSDANIRDGTLRHSVPGLHLRELPTFSETVCITWVINRERKLAIEEGYKGSPAASATGQTTSALSLTTNNTLMALP